MGSSRSSIIRLLLLSWAMLASTLAIAETHSTARLAQIEGNSNKKTIKQPDEQLPPEEPKKHPSTTAKLEECQDSFFQILRRQDKIADKKFKIRQLETLSKQFNRKELVARAEKIKKCFTRWKAEFLHGADFIDSELGWVVGWDGLVLHTNDAGLTWTVQNSSTDEHLTAVRFLDAKTGWVLGYSGSIYHTRDGGQRWSRQAKVGKKTLWSISCIDRKTCWVAGNYNALFRTNDGGASWSRVETPLRSNLFSVHFATGAQGWVVGSGGAILTTADSGKTWQRQISNTNHNLRAVHFLGVNNGWIVGDGGTILRTINGGKNWLNTELEIPHELIIKLNLPSQLKREQLKLKAVQFVDEKWGWAVGLNGVIIATRDGGTTWFFQEYSGKASLSLWAVTVVDRNRAWAAGNAGNIVITIDGSGWIPLRGFTIDLIRSIDDFYFPKNRK